MARREGFDDSLRSLVESTPAEPASGGFRYARLGGYVGTPGGIRESASLAMSSRAELDRNPRPSGSKTDPERKK